ncbi:MAG: bifunctional metallophosphatase/5'-nucleotidase [Oscillospiraceae bacterium]|nr:bifunctional metallophosphatase/5'-nucleotidase [Oscillospiraceae bacterium]
MCREERTEKKRSEKIEEENTMRKFLSVLLAMAMVLSLSVTSFAADTDSEAKAEMAGKTVILHTNDVHGAIEGYAYITALKADYEAKGAEVILVDAGDYSQGEVYVSDTKGLDAVEMMNVTGYDVVTLGNHEFDYGYAQLKENMTKADFKILCANVYGEDGIPIFDANYTYTTKSGVKIGFFGMETPEAQTKANPALIKGLKFDTDLKAVAEKQLEALKDDDVVIALSHLGVDDSSKPYTSYDLYNAAKGIDFIIDGHSHSVMTKGKNGEPIQSTGTKFANIGVIVIDDASKKIESNSLYEIKEDTAKDAAVAAAAQKIIDRIDKEYGAVFAKSKVELNGAKAPNGNRDGETNNGDLITDAMLWKVMQNKEGLTVNEDHVVAITNGGGIRAAIKAGDVTKKDIKTVLPFGNTIEVIYVTGTELLEALEASTFCVPESIGGFPQVSGISYTISTGAVYDANAETYPASTYYGPKSINRVTINSINGKDFKLGDTYAVVTNNFSAAGGDTYYAFKAATAKFDTGVPLDEAVMEYVTKELKGVIGEQYAAPQGRILMNPFKDVKVSSWFGQYVIDLYNDGIINGTSATTYAPNDTLTWAAALKLLLVSNGNLKAADATGADWSKNAIAKAAELGLVAADLDGAKAISRLEFCQVAAKLNKLAESKTESKFTDCADGYVMALVDAKVIDGMTATTFEPDASLTRAQIAKIIYQLNLIEK